MLARAFNWVAPKWVWWLGLFILVAYFSLEVFTDVDVPALVATIPMLLFALAFDPADWQHDDDKPSTSDA